MTPFTSRFAAGLAFTAVGGDEYDRLYQLVVSRDGRVTTNLLSSPPGNLA